MAEPSTARSMRNSRRPHNELTTASRSRVSELDARIGCPVCRRNGMPLSRRARHGSASRSAGAFGDIRRRRAPSRFEASVGAPNQPPATEERRSSQGARTPVLGGRASACSSARSGGSPRWRPSGASSRQPDRAETSIERRSWAASRCSTCRLAHLHDGRSRRSESAPCEGPSNAVGLVLLRRGWRARPASFAGAARAERSPARPRRMTGRGGRRSASIRSEA